MTHRANCFTCKYSILSEPPPPPPFFRRTKCGLGRHQSLEVHDAARAGANFHYYFANIFFSFFRSPHLFKIHVRVITSIMCAIWNKFQWKSMPMRYTCIVCLLNVHESFAVNQQHRVLSIILIAIRFRFRIRYCFRSIPCTILFSWAYGI